jgi:hypothetical protein
MSQTTSQTSQTNRTTTRRTATRRTAARRSRRGARPLWLAAALLAVALPMVGAVASCKQGEGQRCQVQSDCEDGLQCNVGEGVCRTVITGDVDALPPPDAATDAAIDAPDAM